MNRRMTRAELRDEAGGTLIETSVGLAVFLLLVFGFINFSMVIYGMSNLSYATKMAVRYASMNSSATATPATLSSVTSMIAPYEPAYPSNTVTPSLVYSAGGNVVGSTVTVTSKAVFQIVLPGYTLSGLTLSTSASGTITQ